MLKCIKESADITQDLKLFTIGPDPAAPAFVINEAHIRSHYSPAIAGELPGALGQVQMPVAG